MKKALLLAALALASFNGAANAAADSRALPFIGNMVHHNPGEPRFVTKYNDPAWLKSQGWNTQIIKSFPQCAITWDAFDPAIMPAGSKARAFSEKIAASIDAEIAAAKKAGVPVLCFTDFLVVPRSLYAKYGAEMTTGKTPFRAPQSHESTTQADQGKSTAETGTLSGTGRSFSISLPRTRKIVCEQVDEIFKRFPDLDGIVLRFGETYLHDAPFHTGGSPVAGIAEQRALISLLREEICVKRGKRLVYRTWSFGDGFHVNPDTYRKITDAIEPHPLLAFSIKHTRGDYTRDRPFNPTLGIGRHPQLVEVSANQAGLYGKCAWPYYCAKGVIDGFDNFGASKKGISSLVGKPQFAGLWTWSQGDGWAGPYKTNEFWTDINTAVVREFARHPEKSEKELFDAYCKDTLRLDDRRTGLLRELLLLATNATYHSQESDLVRSGDGFALSSWWCRDEYLTAVNVSPVVKAGLVPQARAEKAKAVEDWKRVERMARELRLADKDTQEFVEVSSSYGRIHAALCAEIWTMQLLAAEARQNKTQPDRVAMKTAIAAYDALWAEWRKLKADHACCPTLYRDDEAVHCGPPFAKVLAGYRRAADSTDAAPTNPAPARVTP